MKGFCYAPLTRGLFIFGCASGAAVSIPAFAAELTEYPISLRQAKPATDGNDVGVTRILVDGPTTSGYSEVTNDSIEIWTAAALGKRATAQVPAKVFRITVEGKTIDAAITYTTQRHKFTIPYADPRSPTVANQRNSPVAACNTRLSQLAGAQRSDFLRNGGELNAHNAYRIEAEAAWSRYEKNGDGKWDRIDTVAGTAQAYADATIVCRALARPRPQTSPPTTSGVDPKPGTKLPPVISSVKLRIEPAQIAEVGMQICPTQLKLYGQVAAVRAFKGKAVIFGTGYLSPVSQLSYDAAGTRTVVATYPLSWSRIGGLASTGAPSLKSQSVSLTLNVTRMDNTVLESVKESVTVTCKPRRAAIGGSVGGKAADGDE